MTLRNEVIKTFHHSKLELHAGYKMGISLGYPQCCVFEFIDNCNNGIAPAASRGISGNSSGFVPCAFHSRLVDNGTMTLTDLIDVEKRDPVHGEFKEIWD
jgi:hypothetical protein